MNKIGIPGINMLLQKNIQNQFIQPRNIYNQNSYFSLFLQFLSRRGATETASYMGDVKVNNSQHSIAWICDSYATYEFAAFLFARFVAQHKTVNVANMVAFSVLKILHHNKNQGGQKFD